MTQAAHEKEHYLTAFARSQRNGAGRGPAWLKELRETAIDEFERIGFPTPRDEDWKHTNVEPITSLAFERANRATRPVSADEVFSLSFSDPAYNRLVFVNGVISPELSELRGLPEGVKVQSLAQALADDSDFLQAYLARSARQREHAFVALNTAFIEDGAFVFVPQGRTLDEPIYLIFVTSEASTPVVSHPRNLFVFEANTQARIVESYIGLNGSAYFNNAVTEIIGQEGATIDHYRLQREANGGFHVGALAAELGRSCHFSTHALTLGGSLVRNDVNAVLDGEGAECMLNGLYLVDGNQHVDNQTRIDHVKPHTRSLELYKGILKGRGRAVFNGKIFVHKTAQKTDARQTNKNLLLSAEAVVNTKPQLEIYADDVKCSHGSTIGQLDRDALFYLRSRGLDLDNAQSLLNYAFASDVVSRVKIAPLRARLDDYLLTKFGKNGW
jgi:Fe-S cluster assembly protein SufD